MLSASADGDSFDWTSKLGELHLLEQDYVEVYGEDEDEVQSTPPATKEPRLLLTDAGALLLLGKGQGAGDSFDWLCVEWKAGTEPGSFTFSRFVAFHCWEGDSLASIGYAFSDPEPEWERVIEERPDLIDAKGFPHNATCDRSGMSPIIGIRYNLIGHDYDLCEAEFEKLSADLKPLYRAIHPVAFYRKALSHMNAAGSLMAHEGVMMKRFVMGDGKCIRHAVFPSFEAVLAGLVDEQRARHEGRWCHSGVSFYGRFSFFG